MSERHLLRRLLERRPSVFESGQYLWRRPLGEDTTDVFVEGYKVLLDTSHCRDGRHQLRARGYPERVVRVDGRRD